MSISGLVAAILDFQLLVTSCSIYDSAYTSDTEKHGCSLWNFTPILSTTRDIRISGLTAAIFDSHFRLHRSLLAIMPPTSATLNISMFYSHCNFSHILFASYDMSISGLAEATFDFLLWLHRAVFEIVPPSLGLKSMDVFVGISMRVNLHKNSTSGERR
jgi:hypothetical protein